MTSEKTFSMKCCRYVISALLLSSMSLMFDGTAEERAFVVRCSKGECLNAYYEELHPEKNISLVRTSTQQELTMLNVAFNFIKESGYTTGLFRIIIDEACQKIFSDALKDDSSGNSIKWSWVPRITGAAVPGSLPPRSKNTSNEGAQKEQPQVSPTPSAETVEGAGESCLFDVEQMSEEGTYPEYLSFYFATITPQLRAWLN